MNSNACWLATPRNNLLEATHHMRRWQGKINFNTQLFTVKIIQHVKSVKTATIMVFKLVEAA